MANGSLSYPQDTTPLWRDPLRWTRTNRALAMAFLVLGARLVAALVASSMARPAEPIRLVRSELLVPVEHALWAAVAVWAGLCAVGAGLWRANKELPVYATAVIGTFWVTNGLFIYGNGVTSPVG